MKIENYNTRVLITKEQIAEKTKELGKEISSDYKGKNLLIISMLRGSFIFCADLVRDIEMKLEVDFMITSSYGDGFETSNNVEIGLDIDKDISDYDVLLVDDIIDSGYTMKTVYDIMKDRNPKSLKICTLLDKPSRRKVEIKSDYTGFTIEDRFVLGYGLNLGKHYRNLPDIYEVIK